MISATNKASVLSKSFRYIVEISNYDIDSYEKIKKGVKNHLSKYLAIIT